MNIEQEKMIVESLPSLYPLRKHEEDAIDAVLDALPHWIPCSERLPKAKQKVLVQYADESMATKRCNDEGHLQWFYANAVAWMPAPASWKGEITE
jgi:hypothetical protein